MHLANYNIKPLLQSGGKEDDPYVEEADEAPGRGGAS